MKAPHLELQVQYLADITQTVWGRPSSPKVYSWSLFANTFIWLPDWEYHIGPTPPPEPTKMCELGGMRFPPPESVAPEIGTEIYVAFNTGPQALAFPHNKDFSEIKCPHCDAKFYIARDAAAEALK